MARGKKMLKNDNFLTVGIFSFHHILQIVSKVSDSRIKKIGVTDDLNE